MSMARKLLFGLFYLCCVTCELNLKSGSACVSDGLNGTCISVYGCYSAALVYKYRLAGYSESNLVATLPEICSYDDGIPIVCCTDCELNYYDSFRYYDYIVTVEGQFRPLKGSRALRECMKYFQRLPYTCRGKQTIRFLKSTNKELQCVETEVIVTSGLTGGRFAKRQEFPHMALLGYGADHQTAQWHCGGTIISEWFILTAGHCLRSPEYGPVSFAALGILKRSDPPDYWKIYKIKRSIRHPDYKPPSKYNDIALLETEAEINFGKYILPACLNTGFDIFLLDAVGWGQLGHKHELADNLQIGSLTKFDDSECSEHFPVHRLMLRGYDHSTQLCYGSRDKAIDTCNGDSGGPLQFDEEQCMFTVVGVTSFGSSHCGNPGVPSIFTRVIPYVTWIESIVWPA